MKTKCSYVYLMQSTRTGEYKIGVSKHPQRRKKELQTGHGAPLNVVTCHLSDYPFAVENSLHQYFRESRANGEFFDFSDIGNLFDMFHLLCGTYEQLEREKNKIFEF